MWASNATLDRLGKMLDLAKADWKAVFPVLHRVSDGTPVKGKVWRGPDKFKYGAETVRWLIDGEWMTAYPSHGLTPRREANLKAKGFMWKDMVLPAHVAQSFGNYLGAPVHTFIIADFTDYIL
jgi:hypothetical protein